jgi:hypothetical protein
MLRTVSLVAALTIAAAGVQAQSTGITAGGSVGGSTAIGTGVTGTTNTPSASPGVSAGAGIGAGTTSSAGPTVNRSGAGIAGSATDSPASGGGGATTR